MNLNFWANKRGSKDKQELLACIKFAGNKAEKVYPNKDFTEFVTIDDEGEIYFLKAKELIATNGCETDAFNDFNGNVQIWQRIRVLFLFFYYMIVYSFYRTLIYT